MFSWILLDLTLREVLSNLPHDAGAVVVFGLLSLFVGLTIAGSRRKGPPAAGGPA